MDQSVLQLELAKCTDEAHASALRVYQEGGHSKPIAQVTLSTGLASAVEAGTKVTGTAVDGSQTVGKMFADAPTGATEIEVQYQTSDSQSNYVNCQVGGLPAPNTDGCFAPTGTLTIEDLGSVAYTYDELTGNANGRTLQGFSTNAEALMNNCANCPYNTFNKVRTYYGASDYADQVRVCKNLVCLLFVVICTCVFQTSPLACLVVGLGGLCWSTNQLCQWKRGFQPLRL